ncbi:MAG: SanA/YdcF family protein [Janthinobacterium lividum]
MVSTGTRWLRRGASGLVGAGFLAVSAVLVSVAWVRSTAAGHTYADRDLASVPATPVALVLGAQVYPSGTPSPFLAGRLDLAKRLYDAGLVEVVLVSGDNRAREYDEPDAMRRHLVDAGVPAGKVVADYAGFDTYDSCSRAQRIFGVDRLTVVTQDYHLPRAVATCRALGLDAVGVGDDGFRGTAAWRRGAFRDQVACVKTVLDVVTRRDPVLGERETSVDRALVG